MPYLGQTVKNPLSSASCFELWSFSDPLTDCDDRLHPSLYARLDDYDVLSFIKKEAFNKTIPKPEGLKSK